MAVNVQGRFCDAPLPEHERYLRFLQQEIHTTVVATVDDDGLPQTCVADMMLADSEGLYFLTARGKAFYRRLVAHPHVSITGCKGADTMSSQSVTVRGEVRELGSDLLPRIFEVNPYMAQIYPDKDTRSALTVFQVFAGTGDFFDLSTRPITRASFSFGGAVAPQSGYFVTDRCVGCGSCLAVCPQRCIDASSTPAVIAQAHCLHCGNCYEACPEKAIERR